MTVMELPTAVRHPLLLPSIFWGTFLSWYFWEEPKRIVKNYASYARAFEEIFSFVFLIRTLLKPWKNITDAYPQKGFNIGAIAQAFTLNMTARMIGFLFRFVTLLFGIAIQVTLLAGFLAYLLLWLFFPAIFLYGLGYLFQLV